MFILSSEGSCEDCKCKTCDLNYEIVAGDKQCFDCYDCKYENEDECTLHTEYCSMYENI